MSLRRRPTPQQVRRAYDGRCFVCGEDNQAVLDAHRIFEGEHGGTYHWMNMLVLCSNCHRKVTAQLIRVHRRYQSTAGPVVHWTDEAGEEHYTFEERIRDQARDQGAA